MGVAPGGLIKQCILEDEYSAASWDSAHTITFNVQILNSEVFRQVAGMDPPETPVDAKTYSGLGLPFYKIYNEHPLSRAILVTFSLSSRRKTPKAQMQAREIDLLTMSHLTRIRQ